ncbi:hypothetical protein JRO89_XS07G0064500 [Xanthoceras sorbifolium]|uniref:EF-hand domain-containing protein n=1 Tax=Xanthoceras sorbifolium TaxID=99658 RepID=A0ABQ8HSP1_9ROSI|nr:hypothetical protein JRO89_XS07G0064500 [Xanthoceras sorbifolium]
MKTKWRRDKELSRNSRHGVICWIFNLSRTAADSSTELHKSIQGSTVLRSPSLVALDTGGVSNHPAPSHARTTASKKTSSSHLVPGSEASTLSHNSKTVTVLAGAGLVRDAVGSTKSSTLYGSTKTSDLHGSTKIGVLQGVAMATRAGSCVALDSGMVGGVKDVVQREEVESGAVGEGSLLEILGLGAARVVEHSVGHVHGGLPKENVGLALGKGSSPGGSASFVDQGDAHVLGGLSMMNSGLALALDQGGQVAASLVHPVLHPCMALLDGHGCATHVLPKLDVSTNHDNDDHVLPCKVLEHAHLLHCEGKREEKVAANFIFSAHVGASTTVVSLPSMAAMEVDRKPFKWKRVARRGMVGSGNDVQLPCLGKRVESEPLEGGGRGESVKRSHGANIVVHDLTKFALSHQPVGVRLGSVPSSLALVILDDSRGYPYTEDLAEAVCVHGGWSVRVKAERVVRTVDRNGNGYVDET